MSIAMLRAGLAGAFAALFVLPAQATIISVTGLVSSAGAAPEIIGAPAHALDDIVTNEGMQGFDEAQRVLTTQAHQTDGGGVIPAGTLVDSHMILLNSAGTSFLSHRNVVWTFAAPIIGVMSDFTGALEAASTFELGAPGTNYTVPFGGSGPAAPFPARGMEGAGFGDAYLVAGNTITVNMQVGEPGDWIRVVTIHVPEPGVLWLMALGLGVLGLRSWRVRA